MTKAHVLTAPMTRQQREDVADAMARALAKSLGKSPDMLFTVSSREAGMDIVVRAPTPESAFVAWERHAQANGAEGKQWVSATYTPPAVNGERQPERETSRFINLDMLALMDDLAPLDDEDEALGLPVYRG